MPVSRLTLINDALILTGNNPFSNPDDGSPEWNTCSAAYDGAVEHMLDEHDWKFATMIEDVDDREGDSDDATYADVYAKPDGCLHLIWVRNQDGGTLDWRIINNQIHTNEEGGITVKFVAEPEPEEWPGMFTKCLKHFVMAGVYRGLNKDPLSARAEEKAGEYYLAKARPRSDSEEPGRARFVSSLGAARRTRRG